MWLGFTHLLPRFGVMLIPVAAIAVGRAASGRLWPAGLAVAVGGGGDRVVGRGPGASRVDAAGGTGALFGLTDFADMLADSPR